VHAHACWCACVDRHALYIFLPWNVLIGTYLTRRTAASGAADVFSVNTL
jgi:hypothetical protein